MKQILTISVEDNRRWYDHIGIMIGSPKITIYLPEKEYASLSIESGTGNVEIFNDMQIESVDIALSTGDISIANMTTDNMKLSVSTGDITLENVIVTELLSIERSTGKIKFEGCDAGEILIKTTTGKVNVPQITTGGKCEISTSTGNIKVAIVGAKESTTTVE